MVLISTFKLFTILSTKEKHPESSDSQYARNIKSLIHTLYVCDSLNGEYKSKKEVHFFRKSVKLIHLVYVFFFGFVFTIEAIANIQSMNERFYISCILGVAAFGMFFFRRKYRKKFESRNQ